MESYRVPLVWEVYGHLWIDADSEEEAIEIALDDDTPLPVDSDYISGSLMVDDCCPIEKREIVNEEP